MSETNILALKEALASQQILLQKLYNELDKEREASSTAASEALSMILRLQGEKAVVKMEAEQYKRLAEEKMCYAEESMQIFEDIMYQKEMEIASLDYQVQAYKYKLLSLGCNDPGVGELKFPENMFQRTETLIGETSARSISRRNSAPPVPFKFSYFKNKGNAEIERSESPETDMTLRVVDEYTSEEVSDHNLVSEKQYAVSAIGNKNTYWEQIGILDEQVKGVAGEEYRKLRNGSSSPSQISQASSTSMICDVMKETVTNEADELRHPSNSLVYRGTTNSGSVSVQDIFEVPQTSETIISCGECKAKDEGKMILQISEKCGVPELFSNEAIKLCMKDQADSLGEMLLAKNCKPNNACQPSDGVSVDCHLAVVHPTIGYSKTQNKVQEVHMSSEIVEMSPTLRQELHSSRGEDELKMLNSIQEQLNSIQYEIRSLKPKKSAPQDDLSMASLKEAMLYFWL